MSVRVAEGHPPRIAAGDPGLLGPVVRLARPYRKDLRAAVVSGVVDQMLWIASAMVSAYMVGRAIDGASAFALWPWAIVLGFLVVPQVRMIWLESIAAQSVAARIQVQLRAQLFSAFERLAPSYMLRRRSGDLASVAISDVDQLQRFFAETLPALIVGTVAPTIALAALTIFNVWLGLALAPFLIIAVVVPWWLHARAERQATSMRADSAEQEAEIVDVVQGLREVTMFGDGPRVLARLGSSESRRRHLLGEHARSWSLERAISDLIASAGGVTVLLLAVALVQNHSLSFSLLLPAVVLATLSFSPLTRFHHSAKALQSVRVAGRRIFELLEEPAPIEESAEPRAWSRLEPSVRFDHVGFRYAETLPPALDDVSFEVPEGQTVALVGHSGAGKSTCANLLLRFFDPVAGSVEVGGVDLREIPSKSLREHIAFVSQDVYLFNASIADNIRLGVPAAGDKAVRAAGAAAIADEFILALPDGYATVVGERGGLLSGGQRQRLAIARALLRDPAILVLDEPASSLDAENELALRVAMSRLREGRTTLVIAHRLSTIRSADQVVVLESGRVVEVGTHEDLLRRERVYATLIASQIQS